MALGAVGSNPISHPFFMKEIQDISTPGKTVLNWSGNYRRRYQDHQIGLPVLLISMFEKLTEDGNIR